MINELFTYCLRYVYTNLFHVDNTTNVNYYKLCNTPDESFSHYFYTNWSIFQKYSEILRKSTDRLLKLFM
jgi:hypothetical protein